MLPKVSVAIITYNQKKYLRELIESVQAQNYPSLEIVVADDASSDGTQDMLQEYDQKYPGLFRLVLAEVNGGITINSNLAYFACTGKYIAWMGGDDVMLPGKLHKQVKVLEENDKLAACVSGCELFSDESASSEVRIPQVPRKGFLGIREIVLSCNRIAVASSWMVRRSMCPSDGFDTRLKIASDSKFNADVAANGAVAVLSEPLVRYRLHPNSATSKGLGVDPFLFFAMIEYNYPHLQKEVRIAKSQYTYTLGRRYVRTNQITEAKNTLKISWHARMHIRTLIWLWILSAPARVRDWILQKGRTHITARALKKSG